MGGERFETFGDSYLFGDNSDLNFLGGKPVPVSPETLIYFMVGYHYHVYKNFL